jgi:2-keto-4-pentenoate hydratase/2-oxohepta-3-ene-1,7-dioic acid hydratase in catechol pathway
MWLKERLGTLMRLASFRTPKGASYGAVTDKGIVDLGRRLGNKYPDLKALLAGNGLAEIRNFLSEKADFQEGAIEWLPVIPNPGKIICVGLNYEEHRVETGRDKTEQPALFIRVAESQVGHRQPLLKPRESQNLDYEAEIALIIGAPGRRISQQDAYKHIAGYSCYNDGSVRDWQRHTVQWTAGKNFVATGAFGPWMVTSDEIPPNTVLTLSCRLNGQQMQHATTEMMIFRFPKLIEYISAFTPLAAGDVIVTGTPGGVGARRNPPVWMKLGDTVEIEIDKVGVLSNRIAEG